MQKNIQMLLQKRDELHTAGASIFLQCFEVESELQRVETLGHRDLPPPGVALIMAILAQFAGGDAAVLNRKPQSALESIPATAPHTEVAAAEAEPQQPLIVAEPPSCETTIAEIFPPEEDSPESRLEKCFGPARPPIVTALGCVLDFSERGYVRFELPGGKFDEIKLSLSEWETALALLEASGDGLSNIDLASKVTRWRGKIPNPEAVQRMVSRITGRFESAGMPFRGRTENVHPSGTSTGGPISSTKRRPGRPPKASDGQFRAFLHEISPSISSC